MTELAAAPAETRTETKRINHWIGGAPSPASPVAAAPFGTPRRASSPAPSTSPPSRRSTAPSPPPRRRSPPGARPRSRASRDLLPHPPALRRAPRGPRPAAHGRARQGALGRHGRGRARARGDRVRLRDPDAAQGQLLGAGLDRDRRLLDPPAARRRRRDHAVQLPGDGPDVDVGAGARVREHVRAQAVGEGSVRVDPRRPSCSRRPGVPDGVFNVVHGDKVAVDADPRAPGHRGGQLRRLDADRALHLRDGHEARQARAGARRGEEPHDRAARRRHRDGRGRGGLRGYGSAGERCMAISLVVAVGDVGDELVAAIKERMPKIKVGDGLDDGVEMGPLVTREHRDKVASTSRARARRARRSSPTAARRRPRATASSSASSLLDDVTPEMDAYKDEIFGPVLGVTRVDTYDEALEAREREPVRERHRDLHARRRRRPPVPVRRRGGHGRRSTCRSRCRSRTTRSAAGRRRCSGTRTSTGRRGSTSTPAARSSPRAGRTRPPRRSTSASRRRARRDMAELLERADLLDPD